MLLRHQDRIEKRPETNPGRLKPFADCDGFLVKIGVINNDNPLSAAFELGLICGVPAPAVFRRAILHFGPPRDFQGLVRPSDDAFGAHLASRPACPVFVRYLGAELRRGTNMIEAHSLLDYAGIPNGVQVRSACSRNRNKVAAAIILKGDVQGLVMSPTQWPSVLRRRSWSFTSLLKARSRISFKMAGRRNDRPPGRD